MQGQWGSVFVAFITAIMLGHPSAQAQTYNPMPQPSAIESGAGRVVIDASFRVALEGYQEPRLQAAASRLIHRLSRQTGIPLTDTLENEPGKATLVLHCEHAGEAVQSVREDESYELDVTPQLARLTARTPVGVLRGMETFLQLVELNGQGFSAPAVRIADRPRFPWRGLLIDVCRHWMPVEVLQRNMDAMAEWSRKLYVDATYQATVKAWKDSVVQAKAAGQPLPPEPAPPFPPRFQPACSRRCNVGTGPAT